MMKEFIGDVPTERLVGKCVFVRVDYNIPLNFGEDGSVHVASDARIRNSLDTIRFLISCRTKVVLASHLGRPRGNYQKELSLLIVAKHLQELMPDTSVDFSRDCIGESANNKVAALTPGSILLLENLRFHSEEEQDSTEFARALSMGIDFYVNDAFSTTHRAHASVHALPMRFAVAYCGFAMQTELKYLYEAIENPDRPIGAVVGGVKVSTKLHLLERLMDRVDVICIGGAMVYTFYRALGHSVGDSIVEEDMIEAARTILRMASSSHTVVRLATDCVIANTQQIQTVEVKNNPESLVRQCVLYDAIPPGWQGLDIGKDSICDFEEALYRCRTVIWNGPMGKAEDARFVSGTLALIHILVRNYERELTTIVCGGDTVAAIDRAKETRFSHISMGGGAALDLLSGGSLPGIEVLTNKPHQLAML